MRGRDVCCRPIATCDRWFMPRAVRPFERRHAPGRTGPSAVPFTCRDDGGACASLPGIASSSSSGDATSNGTSAPCAPGSSARASARRNHATYSGGTSPDRGPSARGPTARQPVTTVKLRQAQRPKDIRVSWQAPLPRIPFAVREAVTRTEALLLTIFREVQRISSRFVRNRAGGGPGARPSETRSGYWPGARVNSRS